MSDRLWILGASDPEMNAIERLLTVAGEKFVPATITRTWDGIPAGAVRVNPGYAYRADRPSDPDYARIVGQGGTLFLVECEVDDPRLGLRDPGTTDCAAMVIRVDHHRPGDPGYGKPPAEFMAASSLGQVMSILAKIPEAADILQFPDAMWRNMVGKEDDADPSGYAGGWAVSENRFSSRTTANYGPGWMLFRPDTRQYMAVPEDVPLIAAADHCLAAAYRGQCPGVHPDALLALLEKALGDQDVEVRLDAVYALGYGGEKALPLLETALADQHTGVRREAVYAMGNVGGDKALALLEKVLADEDAAVRLCAAYALGRVGSEKALALIEKALADQDADVRRSAAYVLDREKPGRDDGGQKL